MKGEYTMNVLTNMKKMLFIIALLFATALILPQNVKAAKSDTFTPITPYFGSSVKIGKFYFADGGTNWFWQAKKKKPASDEEMYYLYLTCDDFTTNGNVAYGYHTVWAKYSTISHHNLFKFNTKTGKKTFLKKIVDKVNPDNSREDGFRFGTAYGKNLYYNVTQKLAKKSGSYVYTYKLMCINGKTKKAKTVRKNFRILEANKNYIIGKNKKNVFYVFNLKENKFHKIKGIPAAALITTHNARNTIYLAAYKSKYKDGYKKIILYKINCPKKKAEKLKTMTAPDGEYLDGYLEEGYFKRTVSLSTFSKFNLKTKKSTGITAREYDYDLDPDYGEEEE